MAAAVKKPWQLDPKYMKHVRISATAAMKMLAHAKTGVEKGLAAANRMPVEVMGFLHCSIDPSEPHTIIVTDAFEINADGSEGAVVVEKVETMNAIGELNDCLAFSRQEVVTGWYHSHPFDVGSVPNWFLSDTDVRSQRMWQEMEDKYAPFLSLVVDPLTGLSKGRPEIGAFRTLPPAYTPPPGMGPDGDIWADKTALDERWGAANQSYYCLSVSYFSNPTASALMSLVSRDFLWARTLSSTPVVEADTRDLLPGRLSRVAKSVEGGEKALAVSLKSTRMGLPSSGSGGGSGSGSGSGSGAAGSAAASAQPASAAAAAVAAAAAGRPPEALQVGATGAIAEAVTAATTLASELLRAQAMQATKRSVFCACHSMGAYAASRAAARAAAEAAGSSSSSAAERGGAGAPAAAQGINFAALASSLEVASSQVTRQ